MPIRPGPMELIIVLVIVMMIFGVGRLPQVGNTIGKALREFRHAQSEVETETPPDDPESKSKRQAEQS